MLGRVLSVWQNTSNWQVCLEFLCIIVDLVCCSFSGTFKVKKTVFQDEGFDLNRITEPIYYLNQKKQVYERLTPDIYNLILQDKIKFWNGSPSCAIIRPSCAHVYPLDGCNHLHVIVFLLVLQYYESVSFSFLSLHIYSFGWCFFLFWHDAFGDE